MRAHWFGAAGSSVALLLGLFSAQAQDDASVGTTQFEISGVPTRAAVTPEEQTAQADAISRRAGQLAERFSKMLDESRREKDIMRANCVNRKLTEVNANTRNIDQRSRALKDAASAGDDARRNHEHRVLTVLSQKLDQLDQEATQCLGQSVYEPGASQVVTSIQARSGRESTPNVAIIRIFYGTDRSRASSSIDFDYYGAGRRDEAGLWLGTADVTIPVDFHAIGKIERPSLWKLEFSEDPNRHMVIHDIDQRSYGKFYRLLDARVAESDKREALVFVHGYSVDFQGAVLRTAQLAYDLEFDGAPILYSWPSQGTVLKYTVDETNAAWTTDHLLEFLNDIRSKTGIRRIHIIAHSMGNRPVLEALRALAARPQMETKLENVMLMAPDVDAEVFKQMADQIRRPARRVTLYASSNDRALFASKLLHGFVRAGDSGESVLVLPYLETIDASTSDTSFLGHSYYGDRRTIVMDLAYLIRHGLPAKQRAGLRHVRDQLYQLLP